MRGGAAQVDLGRLDLPLVDLPRIAVLGAVAVRGGQALQELQLERAAGDLLGELDDATRLDPACP